MSSIGMSTRSLLSRLVMTRRLVQPLLSGSSVIKSIDSSFQILSGKGRGLNSPVLSSLQGFTRPQTSQF